jgi:hypothetical protein
MSIKNTYFCWLVILVPLISACAAHGQQTEQVFVGPLGASGTAVTSAMTREELEDHVRRFADRYFTRIALATNSVSEATASEDA